MIAQQQQDKKYQCFLMEKNYNYHNNKIESSNFSLFKTFTNFKMSKMCFWINI